MIDETMPECIFVEVLPFDVNGDSITYTGSNDRDEVKNPVEYVRADLVATSPDDKPLEEGQYRWVKEYKHSLWEPALVEWYGVGDLGEFSFRLIGCDESDEINAYDMFKIGPVITGQPDE